jgi:hypothetical protein
VTATNPLTVGRARATLQRLRRDEPSSIAFGRLAARRARAFVAIVVLLAVGRGRDARAQGAGGAGGAACPSTSAVWANVASLIGHERLPQVEPPASLVTHDLGERYVVAIGERRHEYVDAARDCTQRAQVAAVFVALTLVPPEFLLPASPAPSAPPPSPPAREPWLRVELGPSLGVVVHDADDVHAVLGGALRVAVGGGRVVAVGGAGASLPTTSTLGGVHVREQRVPFDLGVRVRWRRPAAPLPWELGLEAGGVVTALRINRVGGAATTVADWGARAGAILSLGNRRLVPFVGVFADMSFAPRPVALVPDGPVGHASWLRTGVTAGVAWRFP